MGSAAYGWHMNENDVIYLNLPSFVHICFLRNIFLSSIPTPVRKKEKGF